MPVRVAINGFGRIGRLMVRAVIESERTDVDIVAVNGPDPVENSAHFLKFDSVHGTSPNDIKAVDDALVVDGKSIRYHSERRIEALDWGDVDVVAECTGVFQDRDKAAAHLQRGAKRVLVSAPSKGADITVVYGVNHHQITADHAVISNASCTTNCLAPVAWVLHRAFGIEKGFMTTIHAYTGDQRVVDGQHSDLRRARAAGMSMIPTSTGAARAVSLVLPELAGKLDGVSIRVPTANVSVVDLKAVLNKKASIKTVNDAIITAADGDLEGVLGYSSLPLVSADYNHNMNSATVDLEGTRVMDADLARVMAWYDNEWGYSNRMLDTAVAIGRTL